MARTRLADFAAEVPALRAVFLTAMPECLLFEAWVRPEERWVPDEIAPHFGDLVRANREALRSLGAYAATMQVTIESAGLLLVVREVRDDLVVSCAFDGTAPLGMVRLHVKRLLEELVTLLPRVAPEERPRAVRVLEFLAKYAPDRHATLQRVALRTSLPLEALERPEKLSPAGVDLVEGAVRELLGLEKLPL